MVEERGRGWGLVVAGRCACYRGRGRRGTWSSGHRILRRQPGYRRWRVREAEKGRERLTKREKAGQRGWWCRRLTD